MDEYVRVPTTVYRLRWDDRDVDRFFNHVQRQKRPPVQFTTRSWRPAVDMFETPDMLVAIVELAGVDENQVEVVVQDRVLAIRGTRSFASEHQPHSYQVMEMQHGPFERVLHLPLQVDPEATRANMRNGMLEICMPKARTQQIRVTFGQEGAGDGR